MVSTKGRYALIIMLNLAKNYSNNTYLSLSDIAKSENLSIKYLEKIMSILNKNDFFITSRGVDGGYKLAKDPSCYKIGDILKAAEGNLELITCLSEKNNTEKV